MTRWRKGGMFMLFFLFFCIFKHSWSENTQSAEQQFVNALYLQSFNHQLLAPENDMYLTWGMQCSIVEEDWVSFARIVVKETDCIMTMNAGFGWIFLPLVEMIPLGGAIGYVKSSVDLQILYENLNSYGLWNRTVITAHREDIDESFHRFNVLQNLQFNLLNNGSVQVVFLKYFNDEEINIHEFLADSIETMAQSTIIYIDFNDKVLYVPEIIQLLTIFRFKLYFQPLSCLCPLDDSVPIVRNGIIAIPHGYQHPTKQNELDLYLRNLFPILTPDYHFRRLSARLCEIKRSRTILDGDSLQRLRSDHEIYLHVDEKREESDLYFGLFQSSGFVKVLDGKHKETEVDLDILISRNSWMRCFLARNIYEGQRLLVSFPLNQDSTSKTYHALLNLECARWIYPMVKDTMTNLPMCMLRIGNLTGEMVEEERLMLQMNCQEFLRERISFLSNMYATRWNESLLSFHSSYETDGNMYTEEDRLSFLSTVDVEVANNFYMHYEEDQSAPVEDWFERAPFEMKYEDDFCGEPVFCGLGNEFRNRIWIWQNPIKTQEDFNAITDPDIRYSYNAFREGRTCENSKFLLYEPQSNLNGIGSMLEVVAAAMRFAICLDRILILLPSKQSGTILKWSPAGCAQNVFECYFEPLSNCDISAQDIEKALVFENSNGKFDLSHYPYRREKFILYRGLPLDGPCALCYESWPTDSNFFDGLYMQQKGFIKDNLPNLLSSNVIFTGSIKTPWISQFLRVIIRPRKWLTNLIREITFNTMVSPLKANPESDSSPETKFLLPNRFPETFVSLHVRFGAKVAEVQLEPLTRYMKFLKKKLPGIQDIFISTETEAILGVLIRDYPEYRFHFTRYPRIEYLNLNVNKTNDVDTSMFVTEFLYSMAKLYVAIEADGFVGTLSSNWCTMIHHLERTRGDGGYDYYSMDAGSIFTTCF